jgi:hypothetical protein
VENPGKRVDLDIKNQDRAAFTSLESAQSQADEFGPRRALLILLVRSVSGSEAAMLAFIMIAILAVLAFLRVSHAIPALARRKTPWNSPSQVDSAATALRYTHPHARSLSLAKHRK